MYNKNGCGGYGWFINWGVACGCGNMVPETISKKVEAYALEVQVKVSFPV